MSHGHSHHVEENPTLKGQSAIYLALIIAGFVLGLIFFVKSMSESDHHDDSHGTEEHVSVSHADHSWDHSSMKALEFSSSEIMGNQPQATPVATTAPVVVDSTATPATDSTTSAADATQQNTTATQH